MVRGQFEKVGERTGTAVRRDGVAHHVEVSPRVRKGLRPGVDSD